MDAKTKPYRNTLSGSIGAGMGSIFNPGGKKYYILEHRVTSKYHRVGESQEIIVDNIELGRDSHCQVRFDDSFNTVSRHHAGIVRDGDMWKLVQLSKTNSTLLNGYPVKTEWYLQNGDEIQLSINGPKLGFIIPTGKKSTVGSIGLTRRLSLFRQQALRPYKTAIATLACLLVLAVAGLVTWNYLQGSKYNRMIASAERKLESLKNKNAELDSLLVDATKEQERLDSIIKNNKNRVVTKTVIINNESEEDIKSIQNLEDDIFYIEGYECVAYNGKVVPLITADDKYVAWTGTGYLLTDGRFVTAKHCVDSWKYDGDETIAAKYKSLKNDDYRLAYLLALSGSNGYRMVTRLFAQSPSKNMEFVSSQFTMNHSTEHEIALGNSSRQVAPLDYTDWAYVKTDQTGGIVGDGTISSNLPAGAHLIIAGYPIGLKTDSGSCLYGSCQTSGRGLRDGCLLITGKNYEHGNSGGPVFYNDNGTPKAVGIVSASLTETSMGQLIPLCNLK